MTTNQLLTVTSSIGTLLIEYGAEIYRAEESINRIAAAYGFTEENGRTVEVFAIPACLIITIDSTAGMPVTRQRRITKRETNLDRVDKLNNLSRYICAETPNYETIMNFINQIRSRKTYGYPLQVASYAVVAATFALFFGGKLPDALVAGIIGILIKLISDAVAKVKPSVFFENLLCSAFAASAAVLVSKTGFTDGFDNVIIGSLMTLVPGITLTNCMRDFIAGDFLAGLYTMTEALLTAAGLAIGAAAAIAFFTAL
ncbi:MAG: threonine/serine exporter family protein [Oscillospiraceae bacterium]|nr:threonine/serine exporter family protein [Oscillospiraceae bacterium]